MTIAETNRELHYAWAHSYDAARNAEAVQAMSYAPVGPRIFHFITRLAFRAIYFPQTTRRAWLKVFFENRRTVLSLAKEAIGSVLTSKRRMEGKDGSAVSRYYPLMDGSKNRTPVYPSNRSNSSLTTR